MTTTTHHATDRRMHPRLRFTPGYAAVYVQVVENGRARILDGHVYDASEGGVRIELEDAPAIGSDVSVCLQLPGAEGGIFATGRIVRHFDDADEPGPHRMALSFRRFLGAADLRRLRRVLASDSDAASIQAAA